MSIVKHKDKRTGTTYVYESKSYWDKDKQQPRSKRVLIGKLDEETGAVVPTDGRGKKRTEIKRSTFEDTSLFNEQKQKLKEKDILINKLTSQNKTLERELKSVFKEIRTILGKYEERR